MGQPTDERTNAMLSAKAGRRKFIGAGLVALVALAGGGVGLKCLLDSGDGGESANGGLVDLARSTATPTSPAPATATSTPEATAAGLAHQGAHVPESGCPGVTLDYIAQTGQTNKLTVPFSSCVDAQWVAIAWDTADPNQRMLTKGTLAYTIPPGTDMVMPIDGRISIKAANEQGALGIGGYVCLIEAADIQASIYLFDPVLDLDSDGLSLSRGTWIGNSGTALPPVVNLGAANLLLGFAVRSPGQPGAAGMKIVDIAKPEYWVDGEVATAFLAV